MTKREDTAPEQQDTAKQADSSPSPASDVPTSEVFDDSVPATAGDKLAWRVDLPDDIKASSVPPTSKPRPGERSPIYPFLAPPQQLAELGRLGDFRVLKLLGAGGMGLVFLAEDTRLKRLVALKVLKPDALNHADAVQRFLAEAQMMAKVTHDHIITVYQVGEADGVPYFTMQLLRGETLAHRLRHGTPLTIQQVVRIGREIALGLAAAHRHGLIHRDVKPANIWLEADTDRVKLLDFGLARAVEQGLGLTGEGTVLGTPEYMAPEQASGTTVDARADLFSLGCILYQLATKLSPFKRTSVLSILRALELDHPRHPGELAPGIPPALADLIMQMLEKDPRDRPATAEEVVRSLTVSGSQHVTVDLAAHALQLQAVTHPQQNSPAAPTTGQEGSPIKSVQPAPKNRFAWPYAVAICCLLLSASGLVWYNHYSTDIPSPVLDDWVGPPGERNEFGLKVDLVPGRSISNGIHQFLAGDRIAFRIEVERDAYIGIWSVNVDGEIVQLFPNEYEKENLVTARQSRVIPGKGDKGKDYSIVARVDKGIECFRVLASTTPWKEARGSKQGEFLLFANAEEKKAHRERMRGPLLVPSQEVVPSRHEVSETLLRYLVRPKVAR